jgi:predicted SAM-dependent methyltransferase/GT2 family glycosyltransferase
VPKISILMSTYNHARFVEQAIRSVLDQSFGDFEFLITDDGSVDGTPDVVRGISDRRIRFMPLAQNVGACTAVNKLLEQMTGDYYCIQNSDDMYLPGKLQRQIEFMESHPDYAACFSTVRVIDEKGNEVRDSRVAHAFQPVQGTRHQFLNRLFVQNFLCHPTVMLRASVLRKAGNFDERLRQLPDHDMWIRVAQHGNIHVQAEPTIQFRDHGGNTSRKTPVSAFRTAHEHRFLLERFRAITSIPELMQIFPQLRERFPHPVDGTHEFLLAHAALGVRSGQHTNFAIETLFRLMADPRQAALLEKSYGFRWRDLHDITGSVNIYGVHADAIMVAQLADATGKPVVQDQSIIRGGGFEILLPLQADTPAQSCVLQFANPNVVLEFGGMTVVDAERRPLAALEMSSNATLTQRGTPSLLLFGVANPTVVGQIPRAAGAAGILIRGSVKAIGPQAATALREALSRNTAAASQLPASLAAAPAAPPASERSSPMQTPMAPVQVQPAAPQAAAAGGLRLHLGCGTNVMPGWVNLDIEARPGVTQHDLTKPLPFPSGTADFVYCEHFIEHITFEQGLMLMRDVKRVLKPNGVFRLSTPDLLFLIKQYLTRNLTEWENVKWLPRTPCQMVNGGMRLWGHQFLYDEEEMAMQLRAAGFASVQRVGYRESTHAPLGQLECRPYHGELIFEAS